MARYRPCIQFHRAAKQRILLSKYFRTKTDYQPKYKIESTPVKHNECTVVYKSKKSDALNRPAMARTLHTWGQFHRAAKQRILLSKYFR